MKQNTISRLKNKLIEDVTVFEKNKVAAQNNLHSKIYFESPNDRNMRELKEQMEHIYIMTLTEDKKKLEKELERSMRETLDSMKKKKD